jgi:hypothetical protein
VGPVARIFGDFNNMDRGGRVRLNVRGALDDLELLAGRVRQGDQIVVHDDDLEANAIFEWSETEGIWVARLVSAIRDS